MHRIEILVTSKLGYIIISICLSLFGAWIRPKAIRLWNTIFNPYKDLIFQYHTNGLPNIMFGKGEKEFDINWSSCGTNTIYVYNHRMDTQIIGLITNTYEFKDFFNISKYFQLVGTSYP